MSGIDPTYKIRDALAGRNIKDLSDQERQSLFAELRKGPALPPIDVSRKAKDMSDSEKQSWLADLRRRFQ
jgi:hypothetical protein